MLYTFLGKHIGPDSTTIKDNITNMLYTTCKDGKSQDTHKGPDSRKRQEVFNRVSTLISNPTSEAIYKRIFLEGSNKTSGQEYSRIWKLYAPF